LYNVLKEVEVMNDESMGKITILLSKEADKKIRDRAKKNLRSISKEVEYLILNAENKD
jgi:phosphopantetheinyl transferase (holo-ACP synthase)